MAKVLVDPGHGGRFPGAVANGLEEADINLQIALKTRATLQAAGHTVVMTRTTDVDFGATVEADISTRVARIRGERPDFVISIHCNSNPGTPGTGQEVLYNPNGVRQPSLAQVFKDTLSDVFPSLVSRPLQRRTDIGVLNVTSVPSVLVECEFLNNPSGAAFLRNAANQQKLADAMTVAVNTASSQTLLSSILFAGSVRLPANTLLAIDMSASDFGRPVTREEARAIRQVGYEMVVVSLHKGELSDSAASNLRTTIDNLFAERLLVAGYVWVWHRDRQGNRRGPLQATEAFNAIGAARWNKLKFVAGDVERNHRSSNVSLNQATPADLRLTLAKIEELGTAPAWVYTGSYYFRDEFSGIGRLAETAAAGGTEYTYFVPGDGGGFTTQTLYPEDRLMGNEFARYPLWEANWNDNPSYEMTFQFGGWTSRSGHQFRGERDSSGRIRRLQLGHNKYSSLRVDYNIFKRSVLGVTSPQTTIYTPPTGNIDIPTKFIDGGNYVPEVPTTAKQLIYVLGTGGTYRLIFEG